MSGIPVLVTEGDTIARAWENSMVQLYERGCDISTQYDKPGDPPSKDATMVITVENPLAEPMIHRDFPGGFEDLQEYVMEVCDGIKDHLVRDINDAEDTRWEYTYHQRLFSYNVPSLSEAHRPNRESLPAIGEDRVQSPRAGCHLEGVGGRRLLRSSLPPKPLVSCYRVRRSQITELERAISQQ